MKRITIFDQQHKWTLKRFHTLCSQLNMSEDVKRGIVYSYGKESSRDMTVQELTDVCAKLEEDLSPELSELNAWRKRLIKKIGFWCKAMNLPSDGDYIKAIACRAAKRKTFNSIPQYKLCSLYNSFKEQVKDLEAVKEMTVDEADLLSFLN